NTHRVEPLRRGLSLLSADAIAERTVLQARLGLNLQHPAHYDEGTRHLHDAVAAAERLGDGRLLGLVFSAQSSYHILRWECQACVDEGRRALACLDESALYDRAQVLGNTAGAETLAGHLPQAEAVLGELESCAHRAGHLWMAYVHGWMAGRP